MYKLIFRYVFVERLVDLWCLTLLSTILQLYRGGILKWKLLQINKIIFKTILFRN